MKTLKTIILLIIMSLYLTSCTDLITDDDLQMLDTIENTQGTDGNTGLTGGNGNEGSGGGKNG
jgi:hypothetical protein